MSGIGHSAMRRVHIVTFGNDGAARTFTLRRSLIGCGAALKVALIAWAGISLYLLVFRDTLVGKLMADQAQMRAAYEEKLVTERARLDEARSRQASAQYTFEGRAFAVAPGSARDPHGDCGELLRDPNRSEQALIRASGFSARRRMHGPFTQGAVLRRRTRRPGEGDQRFFRPKAAPDRRRHECFFLCRGWAGPCGAFEWRRGGLSLPTGCTRSRTARPPGELVRRARPSPSLGPTWPVSIETVVNSLDTVERLQVEALEHANSRAAVEIDQLRGALKRSASILGVSRAP